MKINGLFPIIFAVLIIFTGCSTGNSVTSPSPESEGRDPAGTGHVSWGLWQFTADPVSGTLDVTPLREGNFHLNALNFLEPPAMVNLTIDSLEFNGDIIDADIGLRHPFLGLTEFSGFDVCGILISSGSVTGYTDLNLRMPGTTDTRLLNPDSLTRWWNPTEFPHDQGMMSYKDGLLGTPDSIGNFNATLNGCKYYCDDLTQPDAPMSDVSIANRGLFTAGQKNVRHFTIQLGDGGLVFNYAVDASWQFPNGAPPYNAPDDFAADANRAEAYRISASSVENSLWNDGVENGGDLIYVVDVYDWFDAGLNTVRIESPNNFPMIESAIPVGGGEGYSTYEVEITDATPDETQIELLISVASDEPDFEGFINGVNSTAYFTTSVSVAVEPQIDPFKNIPLRVGAVPYDIGIDPENGDLWIAYVDRHIYKRTLAGDYLDGAEQYMVPYASLQFSRMDTAAGGHSFFIESSETQINGEAWIFHPDGTWGLASGWGGGDNWLVDVANFGTSGNQANDHMLFVGYFHTYYSVNIVMNRAYHAPDYNANPCFYTETWNNTYTGYSRVHHEYLKGMDTGIEGENLWFLEAPDYYGAAFHLTGATNYKTFSYNNSYFGTGSPSDGDDCWTAEVRDLGHSDDGRLHVLDLVNSEPMIKVFSGSSSGGTAHGHYGDTDSIMGDPLRIDGSDLDGKIIVLHGDAAGGYMISVFFPDEMPD